MSNYGTIIVNNLNKIVNGTPRKPDADDVTTKIIGDFGKWQLKISILMALLKLPLAWFQLGIVFLAPPQNFWCQKPKMFERFSDAEWRDICSPKIEEHPCLIYDPDLLLSVPSLDRSLMPLVKCTEFTYDTSIFSRTITSEWNLVCSKRWLIHFTQCVIMWGVLIGTLLFGMLADKFGRKLPLMWGIFIQSVTSLASSVFPWYWVFLLDKFILSVASGGIGLISFVMCIEVVSGKWRTTIPVLCHLPFGFGNAIMAGVSYMLRDWRQLEFVLSLFSSIYIIYWFFIPESPRWLLAKGQTEKALEILKKAARTNNMEENIEKYAPLLPKHTVIKKEPGFLIFIKTKSLRKKTILLSVNWFCTGLTFYAFSQYLGNIGENIFMTVAMSGIISSPGALICVFVINRVGRKGTIAGFQFITAICFFMILVIPKDAYVNDWPRFLFAGIGFAGMTGTVPALYLFSGELFPTLGRNVGVGGVSTFARIGSMVAPALVNFENFMNELPLIILCVMSLSQILLVLPLPETKGRLLPDTIEQIENLERESKIFTSEKNESLPSYFREGTTENEQERTDNVEWTTEDVHQRTDIDEQTIEKLNHNIVTNYRQLRGGYLSRKD